VARSLIEHHQIDSEQANLLAAWSNGRIGWALQAATIPDEVQQRQERLDTLLTLQRQPRSTAFRWAEERSNDYRNGMQSDVLEWLELWQSWWRDVLLIAAGCPESITHADRQAELEQAAQRYTVAQIYTFLSRLTEAAQRLRENVNPQLTLENVILHLPG
ncbi:MAG: DNA polymerase III subunit delta', partial [Spirulinaceae cyanobacterium RM2_2_10]|nr:DNA polymerase III subunit delta' [Spirulinaceae cyanobacterium RM2_2_10]